MASASIPDILALALPFPVPWRLGHALGNLICGRCDLIRPHSTPTRAAADAAAVADPARPRAAFSPLDAGGCRRRRRSCPVWDLSDLYASPEDPRLDRRSRPGGGGWQGLRRPLRRAAGRRCGGDGLAEAIADYERIEEVLGRPMSYAQLVFAGDAPDPAQRPLLPDRAGAGDGDLVSHLLFFTLELNRLEDAELEREDRRSPALARWRPWLRDLRVFRPHQLSDELEKLLHEKEVTGRSAWNRLFDETVAGMRGAGRRRGADRLGGAEQAVGPRPRGARRPRPRAIGEAFGSRIRLFSLITNTLAKDKEIIDTWRQLPAPRAAPATAPTWSRTRWWTRW